MTADAIVQVCVCVCVYEIANDQGYAMAGCQGQQYLQRMLTHHFL